MGNSELDFQTIKQKPEREGTYSKRDRSSKRLVTPKQTLVGGIPTAKHKE
jgi:hypothetical protein